VKRFAPMNTMAFLLVKCGMSSLRFLAAFSSVCLATLSFAQAAEITVQKVKLREARNESGDFFGELVDDTCFTNPTHCIPSGTHVKLKSGANGSPRLIEANFRRAVTLCGIPFGSSYSASISQISSEESIVSGMLDEPAEVMGLKLRAYVSARCEKQIPVFVSTGVTAAPMTFRGWKLPDGYRFRDEVTDKAGHLFSFEPFIPPGEFPMALAPATRAEDNADTRFGDAVQRWSESESACEFKQQTAQPIKDVRFGSFVFQGSITRTFKPGAPPEEDSIEGALAKKIKVGAFFFPKETQLKLVDGKVERASGTEIRIGKNFKTRQLNARRGPAPWSEDYSSVTPRPIAPAEKKPKPDACAPRQAITAYWLGLTGCPQCGGRYREPETILAYVKPDGIPFDKESATIMASIGKQRCECRGPPRP
jgi:hypothetical protein